MAEAEVAVVLVHVAGIAASRLVTFPTGLAKTLLVHPLTIKKLFDSDQ